MNISLLTSVSKGWLHDEGGFTFGKEYYMRPLYRRAQDLKIDLFLQERFPDYAFYNMESNLVQLDFWQPDYIYVGGIQPNILVGACLGAEIVWYQDQDIDLLESAPLSRITAIADLPSPDELLLHPFIRQFDRQIIELQETRPDLTIIPPFFWDISGRATIHGFITTSMRYFGQSIFIKTLEDPQFVMDLHDWIADMSIRFIRHFAALAGIPVKSLHIGECSGTMIGSEQYDQFVVPFINKLTDTIGPIRLHSCGLSNHLLHSMTNIRNLQVLDTGSNTSVKAVRKQFGHDFQLDLAPPLEALRANADKEVMLTWLDNVLRENSLGPLQLGYHLEPGYSVENCLAVHDELDRRGLIQKGR
jgi:hypothetical protein